MRYALSAPVIAAATMIATMIVFAICAPVRAADKSVSSASREFVQKGSEANMFEIQAAKLALDHSKNAQVRQFAQDMVNDHSKAGDDMDAALKKSKVPPSLAAKSVNDTHQDLMKQLKAASGSDFDKQYIDSQVNAHVEAVSLFKNYSTSGDDPELKHFAAITLPTLEKHLKDAKTIQGELKK